ncbi:hypothetical protein [Mucilaginibacter gotjawali]|uniref:Uncharacterized protein n=2 Tax=Mucilaginibacter gotjawali TaxID=1550579 RepID=A0A125T2F6_9SPHI|nr:hypothetical protein [Mucilaginibacter gotjawali]MBB3057251.1 hypothetical protein [Mucilaginibacter gotjawali]BAU52981.1 hypothetical protein MgSA37_01148 [Mucilaginibacter gotjawali]
MNNTQLLQLLQLLKTDIINSLQAAGSSATGQTAKQLTITQQDNSVQLNLPNYMRLLETGRGPTGPNAVPGDPPMIQRIQQWCREKGIPDKAAWAIKKSIDKKGFKGKPGILSEPLGDDNINNHLNPILEAIATEISKQITDLIV